MMFQKLREIKLRGIMGALGFVIIACTIVAFWVFLYIFAITFYFPDDTVSDSSLVSETQNTEESCNVYGINIHGGIVTYFTNESFDDSGNLIVDETSADNVRNIVIDANENKDVKAIIVEIDSGGGTPVAGEEMMTTFKNSKKPVVAFIRNAGASAAYLAATGAQTIFASKFSDVGSIGVSYSYLENVQKNEKEGLKFIDLSSGKYKETGNSDRILTDEEKALLMRDVKLSHEYFIEKVAENRKLDINKVRALADGSTMMGDAAMQNGLIDKIGGAEEARNFLKEKIGEDVEVCWKN